MDKIFLNIILLFSPNYKNKNIRGTTKRKMPIINQFIVFYKSIKLNLKSIKYDISIVHFEDFNNEDLNKLNKMDVNLIKVNCNSLSHASLERYIVKTKIKGTHRLIAETDMLFVKEPNFNWNVNFQAGYPSFIDNDKPFYDKLSKKYNVVKFNKELFDHNKLFIEYNVKKTNYKNLLPYFNYGLILLKEEFSIKVFNFIRDNNINNIRNDNEICDTNGKKHMIDQIMIGPVMVTLSDNWEPFEPGINFLIKDYDIEKFGLDNIYIIHYAGCNGNVGGIRNQRFTQMLNIYKKYFENI
jgi:hypothetical protein